MLQRWVARLSPRRRLAISGIISCVLILVAARELEEVQPSTFARIVLAPVPWVVGLVPSHNIGTADHPVYEGTPVLFAAALAALPLCAAVYTAAGYVLLTLIRRRVPGV
jgi:hypothetical protein